MIKIHKLTWKRSSLYIGHVVASYSDQWRVATFTGSLRGQATGAPPYHLPRIKHHHRTINGLDKPTWQPKKNNKKVLLVIKKLREPKRAARRLAEWQPPRTPRRLTEPAPSDPSRSFQKVTAMAAPFFSTPFQPYVYQVRAPALPWTIRSFFFLEWWSHLGVGC